MKTLKPLLFIIALIAISGTSIFARCIKPGTPSQELSGSHAVFSGKVLRLEYRKVVDDPSVSNVGGERLFAILKVDKLWKGEHREEFHLRTSVVNFPNGIASFMSEDFTFISGETYLVYASERDGVWSTNGCTRTKKLEGAESELEELDNAVAQIQNSVSAPVRSETGKVRNTKTERELLKANQEYDSALLNGDTKALDQIYADEFIYTTPDGEVRSKSQQLAFTRSGDLKLETGQSSDVKVLVYGKTAVMTGQFTAKGTFKGKHLDIRERYTAVWVKKKGRWQLVAEQGNFIK